MGPILGALGLGLALVVDGAALARVRRRLPPRGVKGPKWDAVELGVGWMGALAPRSKKKRAPKRTANPSAASRAQP
jgi:hypothetical protein